MTGRRNGADLAGAAEELLGRARRAGGAALADLVNALGLLGDRSLAAPVAAVSDHPDGEVRLAVAHALCTLEDPSPAAVAALVTLSRDPVEEVRSWATFALGGEHLDGVDAVRDALVARIDDDATDVRLEALRGLVRRGDARAVDAALDLAPDLSDDPFFQSAVEGLTG
ncbi:MAG TPA: HEAT repeat domain-containing protein [Solirubrobacteraceae bacterium]|nr:HEAT repeat domain-containing protein [Solirubrobacteraceae bacterium]